MAKRRINVAMDTYREFVDSAASKLTSLVTGKGFVQPSPANDRLVNTAFNLTNRMNRGNSLRNMLHRFHIYQQPNPYVTETSRRALWFTEADDPADWKVLNDAQWQGTTQASIRFEPIDSDEADEWNIESSESATESASEKPYKLIFEGVLRPVPPFEMKSMPWSQDSVVPFAQALKPGQGVSPSGETTPLGMLNGFCAFISPNYRYPDLNLDKYSYLALRMKTDGRPYMFNIRCRERMPLLHQAKVPAEAQSRPMHEKEIRFEHFTTTLDGKMKFMQVPVPRDRISSFGFSLSGPPGPFRLELESIIAKKGVTKWEKRELPAAEIQSREQEARIEQQGRSLWWTQAQRTKQHEIETKARELDSLRYEEEQKKQNNKQ